MADGHLIASDEPDPFLEQLLRFAFTAPGASTSPAAGRILARLLAVGAVEGGDDFITPYLVPSPGEEATFEVRTYDPGDLVPMEVREGLRAAAALKIALRSARDSNSGIEVVSVTSSGLERCVLVRDSTGDFEYRFAAPETMIGAPELCAAAFAGWAQVMAGWRRGVEREGAEREGPGAEPAGEVAFAPAPPARRPVPPRAETAQVDDAHPSPAPTRGWWATMDGDDEAGTADVAPAAPGAVRPQPESPDLGDVWMAPDSEVPDGSVGKNEAIARGATSVATADETGSGSPAGAAADAPGSGSPAGTAAHAPGSRSPAGTAAHAPGSGSPAGTAAHEPGSRSPAGTAAHEPGSRSPAGTAAHEPGSRSPAGTAAHEPGSRSPAGTAAHEPGSRSPAGTAAHEPGSRSPAGTAGATVGPGADDAGDELNTALRKVISDLVVEVDLGQVEQLIRRVIDDDRREMVDPLARRISARLEESLRTHDARALVEAVSEVLPRPADFAEAVASDVGALLSETVLRRRPGESGSAMDASALMGGIERLHVRVDGLEDQFRKTAGMLHVLGEHLEVSDRRAAIAERITLAVDQEMQRLANRIDEQVVALAATAGGGSELSDGVARLTRKMRQSVLELDRAVARVEEVMNLLGGERGRQVGPARGGGPVDGPGARRPPNAPGLPRPSSSR